MFFSDRCFTRVIVGMISFYFNGTPIGQQAKVMAG
jgi:hypothetical protein